MISAHDGSVTTCANASASGRRAGAPDPGHIPDSSAPSAGTAWLPVGRDEFREVMAHHPAGVAIITLAGPAGLTVTSFSSASLDPPLVSFYIGHGSSNIPAVRRASHFAVNLIGAGQPELAARFARKGEDRFAPPTRWQAGPHGLPLLTDATTHLICTRHSLQTVGDHELVIGTVVEATVRRGEPPLVYHQGGYARTQSHA